MEDHAKAVWQRVQAGRDTLTAEEALLPERLSQHIMGEKGDSQAYRRLALRFQGQDSAALRRMAEEESGHARELNALYYMRTGRRTDLRPREEPQPADRLQALRGRYLEELSGAAGYAQAARDFPAYGEMFQRLSQAEHRHSQALLEILQRHLETDKG